MNVDSERTANSVGIRITYLKTAFLVFILVITLLPAVANGREDYWGNLAERHPHGSLIGGSVLLPVVLALVIGSIGFAWLAGEPECIGLGILWILILSPFGGIGAELMWEGGKVLGVWQSALAGKIVVSVLTPILGASLVFAASALWSYGRDAAEGYSSPVGAAILAAFFLISGLWMAGHVFADLEKALAILPSITLLAAYLIVGAIVSIACEPEVTGNIILDASLVSFGCLAGGLLLSLGLWSWFVILPATSVNGVITWVTTWLAASFIIRCLIGGREETGEQRK